MEFCTHCGAKLSLDAARFCAKCGKPTQGGALCPQCEQAAGSGSKKPQWVSTALAGVLLVAVVAVVGLLLFGNGQGKKAEVGAEETRAVSLEATAPATETVSKPVDSGSAAVTETAKPPAETQTTPTTIPTAATDPTVETQAAPTTAAKPTEETQTTPTAAAVAPTEAASQTPGVLADDGQPWAVAPTGAATQTQPATVHSHSWTEATCTTPKLCLSCGETEGSARGHDWMEATCTSPKLCRSCAATEGSAAGHDWMAASCTSPKTCRSCGSTEGSALGHDWVNATCTAPQTCLRCGLTQGIAIGHRWAAATCMEPKTCLTCGAAEGIPGSHSWVEATITAPKTCSVCGLTMGEPSAAPASVFINELPIMDKCGKVWTRSQKEPDSPYSKPSNPSWSRENVPGHTLGAVKDNKGNEYTYGIHVDGDNLGPYYISYNLGGKFKTFSGTIAYPGNLISTRDLRGFTKYVVIKGDGKELDCFEMNSTWDPIPFTLDVTNVKVLTIEYPDKKPNNTNNDEPNEIATLFDGRLES